MFDRRRSDRQGQTSGLDPSQRGKVRGQRLDELTLSPRDAFLISIIRKCLKNVSMRNAKSFT